MCIEKEGREIIPAVRMAHINRFVAIAIVLLVTYPPLIA